MKSSPSYTPVGDIKTCFSFLSLLPAGFLVIDVQPCPFSYSHCYTLFAWVFSLVFRVLFFSHLSLSHRYSVFFIFPAQSVSSKPPSPDFITCFDLFFLSLWGFYKALMILLCLGEKTRKLVVSLAVLSRTFLCGSELRREIPTLGLCSSLAGQIFRTFLISPGWWGSGYFCRRGR